MTNKASSTTAVAAHKQLHQAMAYSIAVVQFRVHLQEATKIDPSDLHASLDCCK